MLGYVTGVYDILRIKDLQKLDMIIQKNIEKGNKYFAIALYDEELCEALGISEPLKSIEDRIKIVEQLSGVDFAFKISSLDKEIIQDSAQEALKTYEEKQKIKIRILLNVFFKSSINRNGKPLLRLVYSRKSPFLRMRTFGAGDGRGCERILRMIQRVKQNAAVGSCKRQRSNHGHRKGANRRFYSHFSIVSSNFRSAFFVLSCRVNIDFKIFYLC